MGHDEQMSSVCREKPLSSKEVPAPAMSEAES